MAKTVSSKPAASQALKQQVRGVVSSLVDQYFKSTLGTEANIVDYVMGLIQFESGFRPNVQGPEVSDVPTSKQQIGSSRAKQYMGSDPIRKVIASGSPEQRANIQSGKVAQGLMQVMGWNIVRGGSSTAKRCELEEIQRDDVVSRLCIDAGDNIESRLLGEANIENNILAGLSILDSKYRASRRTRDGTWTAGGTAFGSRLAAAVGAYLGVGGKDLRTGVTADQYVASIIGGQAFRIANGGSAGPAGSVVRTAQATTPSTNSGGQKGTVPGC